MVMGRGGADRQLDRQKRHSEGVAAGGGEKSGNRGDNRRVEVSVLCEDQMLQDGWVDGQTNSFSCQNPEARSRGGFPPFFGGWGVCAMTLSKVALALTALTW